MKGKSTLVKVENFELSQAYFFRSCIDQSQLRITLSFFTLSTCTKFSNGSPALCYQHIYLNKHSWAKFHANRPSGWQSSTSFPWSLFAFWKYRRRISVFSKSEKRHWERGWTKLILDKLIFVCKKKQINEVIFELTNQKSSANYMKSYATGFPLKLSVRVFNYA